MQARRRGTGTSSTKISPRAPASFNFPASRHFWRNRQRVQHHARRTAEPHRPARDRACSSQDSIAVPRQPDAGPGDALRMARHADRARQQVRRLRRVNGVSLIRVGVDRDRIYRQNNRNFEPRLGLAWTSVATDGRWCAPLYARTVDEPGTTAVRDTAGNPPFAAPLTACGLDPLGECAERQRASRTGAGHQSILSSGTRRCEPGTSTCSVSLAAIYVLTLGYFGSHGSHLRISRNLNQPVNGVRPFASLSAASPILPGAPLGNITQVETTGFSSYHGGWISFSRRLAARPPDGHLLHVVEIARHELAEFVGLRGPGQLRYSQPVRLVGFRRSPPVRPQRDLRVALCRPRTDTRLAARHDRPVAERQSGEHRDQQREFERHAEHGSPGCHGSGAHHRRSG